MNIKNKLMGNTKNVIELMPKKLKDKPKLPKELIEQIQAGHEVNDRDFDQIFPPYYQFHSSTHWSRLQVARQIAEWLRPYSKKRFIDIGCGIGKLCVLLRLLTDNEIHGIEQRPSLVQIANEIIDANQLKNLSVANMNMMELDWSKYDIYYLYNPFQEHIADTNLAILENDLELDAKYYALYTSEVFRQLTWAEPGKILLTYHGYGGSVPKSWKLVACRRIESGELRMWINE